MKTYNFEDHYGREMYFNDKKAIITVTAMLYTFNRYRKYIFTFCRDLVVFRSFAYAHLSLCLCVYVTFRWHLSSILTILTFQFRRNIN